ncbi:MAG: hypothetical protein ACI8PZ_001181 [Myxococcota bacterium]|jgi:hypothetical protein
MRTYERLTVLRFGRGLWTFGLELALELGQAPRIVSRLSGPSAR